MEKRDRIMKLRGERVWRTYLGGREIDRLRGTEPAVDGHFPEEWMYSVTTAANAGREEIEEGLCKLDDGTGRTLKTVIDEASEEILGTAHVAQWGNTPGVLIKLLDSRERLTIQVHPTKTMAERLFGSCFGKTECWYILGTRTDSEEVPCIYLGFREGITREIWEECFAAQDYDRMLGLLHRIEVQPGEVYLVGGGVPHAIGAGCLIVEIQEPTDYTIRVERVTPSGFAVADSMCHQGLGFERMFECFDYTGYSDAEILKTYRIIRQGNDLINYRNTPCFKISEFAIAAGGLLEFPAESVFSCLYVLSGSGIMRHGGQDYPLQKHQQYFLTADTDEMLIISTGDEELKLLKMYGPDLG